MQVYRTSPRTMYRWGGLYVLAAAEGGACALMSIFLNVGPRMPLWGCLPLLLLFELHAWCRQRINSTPLWKYGLLGFCRDLLLECNYIHWAVLTTIMGAALFPRRCHAQLLRMRGCHRRNHFIYSQFSGWRWR